SFAVLINDMSLSVRIDDTVALVVICAAHVMSEELAQRCGRRGSVTIESGVAGALRETEAVTGTTCTPKAPCSVASMRRGRIGMPAGVRNVRVHGRRKCRSRGIVLAGARCR